MDEKLAETFIGKYLMIGMTYLDQNEEFIEQKQFHGRIVRINEREGVVVRLHNSGEEFALPPALESLEEAPEGEYRLHSTGEVVVNPDLMTTWTSRKRDPEAG